MNLRTDATEQTERTERTEPPPNGGLPPATGPSPFSERLKEPDLSYYLALRRQFDFASVQLATLQQALATVTPILEVRYQLGPQDTLSAEGIILRAKGDEP